MSALLQSLTGDPEIEALLSDESQIAQMIRFERALAMAEGELGMIPGDDAREINTTLRDFAPDMAALRSGIAQDGVVVPALVAQLRAALGAGASSLHRGVTSQDVTDTAFVMQIAAVLPILSARVDHLLSAYDSVVETFGDKELSVAAKVKTWRAPLRRSGAALAEAGREVTVVQLGGPDGDNARLLAEQVGPRLGVGRGTPWHSERDRVAGFAAELSKMSGVLGKFGADVTRMPQMADPVDAQVLVALARYNAGLLGTLHQALVHEAEHSGAAWTLEWLVLPQMIVTTGASLRLGQKLVDRITF